jgi:hypothetical protein
MNFDTIEEIAQTYASNTPFELNPRGVECLLRESNHAYTGAVVECRFISESKASEFASYIVRQIDYHAIVTRRKKGKYVVSVPVV